MIESVEAGGRTDDGAIMSGAGEYYGARLSGDATNAATVIVYDNTAASGKIIDRLHCAAAATVGEQLTHPVRVLNGIFLDVTTPGRVVVWHIATGT